MEIAPLLVGGAGVSFVVGGAFGARHAFEADHVAAVATLVDETPRPGSTGIAWGVGHALPIVALGAVFLALDLRLPAGVTTALELVVVAILVVLGVRALTDREPLGLAVVNHVHGGPDEGKHRHLSLGDTRLGVGHTHADRASLAVGVVHGLAGSGGVVVALAATSQTATAGLAFLFGFAATSVAAMGAAAWLWGRAIHHTRWLRVLAGLVSLAVAGLLLADVLGIAPAVG